jgi:predicted nucleic acid-binding protein
MMTKNSKAFVDTNVLLRALNIQMPLHQEADSLIKQTRDQKVELWISRQVIREYLVQITRPQALMQPLAIEQVENQIKIIHILFRIADETATVTDQLLTLLRQFPSGGKQIHDVNIVATMLAYDIDTLLTHNIADLKRFESKIRLIPLVENTV